MPPKVKSKGPVPTAHFAFSQRSGPPAPAPLAPHRRQDAPRALLVVKDKNDHAHMVALYVAEGKLCAVAVAPDGGTEAADASCTVPLQCAGVDLNCVTVSQISATDGSGVALVSTELHGVLVVGRLSDEPLVVVSKDELLPVRVAARMPGSNLTPSPTTPTPPAVVIGVSSSTRHALALVGDAASGGSRVAGFGFTDMCALGTPPPNLTTVHPTDGLGKVPRPKQQLHEGALPLPFLPFVWLRELGAVAPTAVFASRHMSFFVCPHGVLACGQLSLSCSFSTPRLVLAKPHVQVLQVVTTNRGVFALLRGNRVLCMQAPQEADDDPEETVDDEGMPVFVDITDRLGLGAASLSGEDDRGALGFGGMLPQHAQLNRLAGGADHCLVVDAVHGAVYGWGSNAFGQLGHPPTQFLEAPRAVEVPIPSGFASVHAMGMRTVALDEHKRLLVRHGR